MIYDTARKRLLDLKDKLENFGFKVYGCNTDALYFNNDYELFEKFKEYNHEMYDDLEIGKLKVKNRVMPFNSLITRKNYENNYKEYIPIQLTDIIIKNEFDNEEISSLIDEHENRVIVKADIAGAGKTHCCIHYCKKYNQNALFITPYNALSQKLRVHDNVESITYCKLMGTVFTGVEVKEQGSKINIDDYDVIVFDEIYLYNTNQLQKIREFMNNNNHIKFLATGDEYQLEPIENLNSLIVDEKAYYNNIIKTLFHNQIQLHENKRCNNDIDRTMIKTITKQIRDTKDKKDLIKILKDNFNIITDKKDIKTHKNVCGFNKTIEIVNDIVHVPIDNQKYYIGLQVICRTRYKYKKDIANVNYTYTIDKINDNLITIIDDEENSMTMSKETLEQYFKLSYARTCHGYQGMSENEPITIFDIYHPYIDSTWIYTAITRTTALKNISIFLGNLNTDININDVIEKMIATHKYNDIKAKRKIREDYVNKEWVLNKLNTFKKCRRCKINLELSRGFNCFSINRLNNSICHSMSNCEIICVRCNKALGDRLS